MNEAFHKTEQSMNADRGLLSGWSLILGLALVAVWMVWAVSARVARYEVSDSARLEVSGAASPIQASLAGEVAISYLSLGEAVEPGRVLLELTDRDQQLALKQEQIRRSQLEPQLAALQMQVQTEDAGRADERQVLVYSKGGAQAQLRQSRIEADLAAQENARAEKLHTAGLISEADWQKARAAAESKRADAETLEQAEQRLSPELLVRDTDRTAKQRQILTDIAKLESDMATSNATIERLRYEVDRRKLRATIAGRLTECAVLHAGAHISEGQQLGVVLPPGNVQIIADFDPSSAFGKLHPGQHATVRLNGFPWAQFGVLKATVSRVAGEIRDGKVRVELALNGSNAVRMPLQHGLPGSVEVEVERISPAAMLLRSAGQVMGAH